MHDVLVTQVAMGLEHTLLLVNTDDTISNGKYNSQPEFTVSTWKEKPTIIWMADFNLLLHFLPFIIRLYILNISIS